VAAKGRKKEGRREITTAIPPPSVNLHNSGGGTSWGRRIGFGEKRTSFSLSQKAETLK
jgi:hypothetical protein